MIHVVPEVGSTNEALRERLAAGEHVCEGEWLVADRQTAGRGRQGRTWFDGAGNFMGSTIIHVRPGDPALATLSLVAGVAVASAVDLPGAKLKWPNDLLVGPAKIAGMLLESTGTVVILGIGVNLVAAPVVPGRVTAALADFGAAPARDSFARTLANAFDLELQRWRDFGTAAIISRWCAAAHPEGTMFSVDIAGEQVSGTYAGLDAGGAMRLRLADGQLRAIHAGEVSLAAMGGS